MTQAACSALSQPPAAIDTRTFLLRLAPGLELALAAGWNGVLLCTRGAATVTAADYVLCATHDMLVLPDGAAPCRIDCAPGTAGWLACATPATWATLLPSLPDPAAPALYAGQHPAPPDLAARVEHALEADGQAGAVGVIGAALDAVQEPLDRFALRCPDGNGVERRRTLHRLERVRLRLRACAAAEPDVTELAALAGLAPAPFVRLFHRVYGETPASFALGCRIERARVLVAASDLRITQIAHVTGFRCPIAFHRAFRDRYGVSARQLRHAWRAAQVGPPA